jgi:hypothetical protein
MVEEGDFVQSPESTVERPGGGETRHGLSALLVFAFLLRTWGVSYGLPFVEEFTSDGEKFVPTAVRISVWDPNPHWFGHPGSTVIYPLAFVYHLGNWLGRSVGMVGVYVEQAFQHDPTLFYATGRLLAAVAGTVSVFVIYMIGKEVANGRVALVAAGLCAISPLDVTYSHLARPDTPAVLFTSLCMLFCVKVLKEPRWEYYAGAGVSGGLATSSKYYGLLVIACLPLAHLMAAVLGRKGGVRRSEKEHLPKLLGALACVAVTFAITSPFVLLDPSTALGSIMQERRTVHLSADGLSPVGNLWWYARAAAPDALGWAVVLLVPLGVWWAVRRKLAVAAVLGCFAVVYIGGISSLALHWDRWLLPAVPSLAVLSALGLEQLHALLRPVLRPGFSRIIGSSVLLALVAWQPASEAIVEDINRTLPDTRILAREWIQANLAAASAVATDAYAAPLDADRFRLMKTFSLSQNTLEYYAEQEIEYLVTSSRMRERFAAEPDRYQSNLEFYGRLDREGGLIYQIAPIPWQRAGPIVSVYQIRGAQWLP